MDEIAGDFLIVIFEKDGTFLPIRIVVNAHQLLQDGLCRFVLRMSFACKYKLHGPLCVIDHLQEPFDVGKQQIPAFVGGDTASETNGQHVRRKQAQRVFVFMDRVTRSSVFCAGPFADECDQQILKRPVRVPDIAVGQ